MRAICLLIVVLALAGCASTADEPVAAAPEPTTQGMSIHGVVVDTAVAPLEGVVIAIAGTNFTTTTPVDGSFLIPIAAPGAFELIFMHPDFLRHNTFVTVGDNEAVEVQAMLETREVLEPFTQVKKWDGFIQCSVRTPATALSLCEPVPQLGDDAEERYTDVDMPSFVQSEMVWESGQPLAESMRLMYTDDNRQDIDNYRVADGASPIMINADNVTLQFKHLEDKGLFLRVFTGDFQSSGASVTAQQGFAVITTIYHNYAPADGWMYIDNDAVFPPP